MLQLASVQVDTTEWFRLGIHGTTLVDMDTGECIYDDETVEGAFKSLMGICLGSRHYDLYYRYIPKTMQIVSRLGGDK